MASQFIELFSSCAASATARQLALGEILGERDWSVDLGEGTASFDELTFPLQLLGTEAESDQSWLWAWANTQSAFPDSLLQAARRLREMSDRLPLFATRSFHLREVSGHQIAMIAGSLLDRRPYYRGPYEGGAVYFLLEGVELPPISAVNIADVITQTIRAFELDHRLMLRSFLAELGYSLDENGASWRASGPGGALLDVAFDADWRIAKLELSVGGRPLPTG